MVEVVFGTLCLAGLVGMAAGRRGRHHGGCGPHGAWRGRGGGGRWGHAWRGPLGGLGRAMKLRDDQEEVLAEVLREGRTAGRRFAEAMGEGRSELAAAVRGERLDDARLAALFEVQDDAITTARRDLVEALRKGHAALEPEQRAALADWITRRSGWGS